MSRIRIDSALHLRCWMLLLAFACGAAQTVSAQTAQYAVDQSRSLVWWQLDPHYGHLWATTCPRDPSWQPGEGYSAGYAINYKNRPKYRLTKESESRLPLFPRDTVRANCRRAVTGSFTASAAAIFRGLKGSITVEPDSITNGSDIRDRFAEKYVYSSAKYPYLKFTIDSLTSVATTGDTITAIAVGNFEMRGILRPTRVQVQGVREASGLRVRGMFAMPAKELRERYDVSKIALGLGVGMKLWETLFMGFDLVFTEQPAKASN
jgi:hypothetical protein